MCSKCFKQTSTQLDVKPSISSQPEPVAEPVASPLRTASVLSTSSTVTSSAEPAPEAASPRDRPASPASPSSPCEPAGYDANGRPIQGNLKRCWSCKCKISPVQQVTNKCRCGYIFCDAHRYANSHECDFDFHERAQAQISKENPKAKKHLGVGISRLGSD